MYTLLVSYDLDKPGQDYSRLIARLKQYGAVRVLYSTCALRTKWTPKQLRDDLKTYVDSNDMLLVTALTGVAAWTSLMVSNDSFKKLFAA